MIDLTCIKWEYLSIKTYHYVYNRIKQTNKNYEQNVINDLTKKCLCETILILWMISRKSKEQGLILNEGITIKSFDLIRVNRWG